MKKTAILLFVILLAGNLFSLSSKRAMNQFMQDFWSSNNGLPQNTVSAMVQTRDGYIWMGTEEGFVKFDGMEFTLFDSSILPIEEHMIFSMTEDPVKPILWIATGGSGLVKFNYETEKAEVVASSEGLDKLIGSVNSTAVDGAGNVWMGTQKNGVICFKRDGVIERYTSAKGLPSNYVNSLVIDKEDRVWVSTQHKKLVYIEKGLIKNGGHFPAETHTLYMARDGKLWVGTHGKGLYIYNLKSFSFKGVQQKILGNKKISSISMDSAFNIYVGVFSGELFRLPNGGLSEAVKGRDTLKITRVRDIMEDREGTLWLGTQGGGLVRLKEGKFITYGTNNGLLNEIVFPIFERKKGGMWIGTMGGGLYKLKNKKFQLYTYEDILTPSSSVYSIFQEQNGTLWASVYDRGVLRIKGGITTSFTVENGLAHNTVSVIYGDSRGGIWLGHNAGVDRVAGDKVENYGRKDGVPELNIRSIIEDRSGRIWIGTKMGAATFQEGSFVKDKDPLLETAVWSIFPDEDGTILFGTDRGLVIRSEGKSFLLNRKTGLHVNRIFGITKDDEDGYWITSNKGIMYFTKKQLKEYVSGKSKTLVPRLYGVTDGLLSPECNGGTQPNIWKSKDGRVWFPTSRGAAVIDPSNIAVNRVQPPVDIVSMKADNKAVDLNRKETAFEAGTSAFQFEYTGLSFLFPEQVRFKYRLEGQDSDWIEAGTRRSAFYTNLKPGEYTFTVIAANNDGVWNKEGASFSFELEPHFWQTVIFKIFIFLLTVFSIYAFIRIKITQARARESEMAHIIETRTKDLREIMSHVKNLSGTLADISNSMVSNTGTTADRFNASYTMIDKVSSTLSDITSRLSETRREVVSMNDTVENLSGKADKSSELLTDAVESMELIETSAGEIHNIVEVVNEIAFKTNLLSLNAAIEAARAGDAGKGFAVVADSVRELSQQTAEAVSTIRNLIDNTVKKGF
jgi:ligand-binding sensor domain-containing protein